MNHARTGFLVFALLATAAPAALAAPPLTADDAAPAPRKAARKSAKKPPARKPAKPAPAPVETAAPEEEEAPRAPERRAAPSPAAAPALTSAAVKDAPAGEPDDEAQAPRPITVAPVLGYATANLKLGVGVRGGYTLGNRVYIGGTFVFHLGTSESNEGPAGTVESSARFLYTGAEGGYDIPVGPVVIRPYAGVGLILGMVSLKSGGESNSDTSSSLAFWPGCTVTYAIPRSSFYVGGDTKIVIATKGGDPSFGMFATGGMRF
ncbi:MAG TPA: outer membrane beta-barrel protein [Labilithrix sp.]|nr:outer membrane beta-barrel protein [Labilithrix sp.]